MIVADSDWGKTRAKIYTYFYWVRGRKACVANKYNCAYSRRTLDCSKEKKKCESGEFHIRFWLVFLELAERAWERDEETVYVRMRSAIDHNVSFFVGAKREIFIVVPSWRADHH